MGAVKPAKQAAKPVKQTAKPAKQAVKQIAKPVKQPAKPAKQAVKQAAEPVKQAAKKTVKSVAATEKQLTPHPIIPPKNSKGKLCLIVSYEKLEPKVKKLFDVKFEDGYEEFIERFTRKNGEYFYAVRFETDDAEYLIKVDVNMDLVGYEEDDIVKSGGDDTDTDVNSIENTVSDDSNDDSSE